MRFAALDRKFSGISVPVSALRSEASCGVGEFMDLAALGPWCRQVGLDLIQILPVNDTGTASSPYSAVSAFALHPLYIDLERVPGAARYRQEIASYRRSAGHARLSYGRTLAFKLELLDRIYADNASAIEADEDLQRWRERNPWIVAYAVFRALKRQTGNAPWSSWAEMADPSPGRLEAWWDSHRPACLQTAWVQRLLEKQLSSAAKELEAMGVFLKGDLPILMSRESVDVWSQRRFFDLGGVAGAPPDMFSPSGQNWGFPVYDWERLANEDYRWWRDRLERAGRFFHAIRIDHVLGFFRIWRIPGGETSGLLGRFSPSKGLSEQDLADLGLDDGRLRWLTLPHLSGAELRRGLSPDDAATAERYLRRIGAEDLFNPAPEWDSEQAIHGLSVPAPVKDFLLSWHANRALLEGGNRTLMPAWYMESSKAFRSLTDSEKSGLQALARKRRAESEEEWERTGRRLLSALKGATDALICAEDLGDVPRCVPRVLEELGILGLRILRWAREYHQTPPGQAAAFTPPERYPALSVCTPSVHDTSTVRGWWQEDPADRELFFRSLGQAGPCPPTMEPDLQAAILLHCASARSLLCIFQIQDLLDLDPSLWSADPAADRINVPGTVSDQNWTWRMPLAAEELASRPAWCASVEALSRSRRS